MLTAPQPDHFEFSGFRLDRRSRSLIDGDGNPVIVNAKAFDTLVYFLEHSGQVVARSTMLEALWPDTIVEENNLSQAVAALRRALGSDLIVTVPRRGYQFVAKVWTSDERVEGVADFRDSAGRSRGRTEEIKDDRQDPASSLGATEQRLSTWSRRLGDRGRWATYLAAAVIILAGAYIVAHRARQTGSVAASTTNRSIDSIIAENSNAHSPPKVAVLPCENLSPDPDDAYFAAGIHEEILNQLTKLSGIRVIARSSVLQYQENRPSISQIAKELDAQAVMECSVRYADTEFMVAVRLIDPETEEHLWAHTYPGDLSDLEGLFGMQTDIATRVANALEAELSDDEERRLEAPPTQSPAAYVAFLKNLEHPRANDFSELDRAIEIDPNFALAYAYRGLKHALRAYGSRARQGSPKFIREEIELAVADADRALEIDSGLGLAHLVSAARYFGSSAVEESLEANFDRALALSPNDVTVLQLAADWHLAELRPERAHPLVVRNIQLDPQAVMGPHNNWIKERLFVIGDFETLSQVHRRRIELEPTSARERQELAFAEAMRGNRDEARRQLAIAEQLLADFPSDEVNQAGFCSVYAYSRIGHPADARRIFNRFLEPLDEDKIAPPMWFIAYLGIGDVDGAYRWAKVITERATPHLLGPHLWLALNTLEDPVLERPEFLELRRKLGYRE